MSIDLLTNTLVAAQAALDGGAAILDVYNNEETQVAIKGDDSPLTQADLKSNAAIMEHLSKTSYWALSEEGKHMKYTDRKDISTMWIVDPLDGTKEFIKRNGEFTVNIALVQDGSPVLGAVYVPVTGELYLGVVGQGSKKYHFDGHDFGPIGKKSDYTLYWTPKTYKSAVELLYDMKKKKRINPMKSTRFSLTING